MSNQINQQEWFLSDDVVLLQVPEYSSYYVDLERGLIYSIRTGDKLKQLKTYKRKGKHNYITVTLIDDNGNSRCMGLHEALMAAREQFWDWKYTEGLEVNHINEDKSDNTYDNLELVTREQQYTESVRKKISESKRGSKHHLALLNEDDVRDIRDRFDEWDGRKCEFTGMLADEYGVSMGCINSVVYGQTWQHVI
ncbi:hypothetical protein D3C74_137760 [compost metagenome]